MLTAFPTLALYLGIDPLYYLLLAPGIALALWAQWRVHSAFARASEVHVASGISGAETARMIMEANGVRDVNIEIGHGTLSDHYDPRHKVVRLSPEVYNGRSAASLGIAAHEIGHVMQEKSGVRAPGHPQRRCPHRRLRRPVRRPHFHHRPGHEQRHARHL